MLLLQNNRRILRKPFARCQQFRWKVAVGWLWSIHLGKMKYRSNMPTEILALSWRSAFRFVLPIFGKTISFCKMLVCLFFFLQNFLQIFKCLTAAADNAFINCVRLIYNCRSHGADCSQSLQSSVEIFHLRYVFL